MAELQNEFNKLKHITAKFICKFQKFSNKINDEQEQLREDFENLNDKIDYNNQLLLNLIEQLKNKEQEINDKIDEKFNQIKIELNDKINEIFERIDEVDIDVIEEKIKCIPNITNELYPTYGKTTYFNENKGNILFSNFGHIKRLIANSFTNVSDKRMKSHIKPLKNSLKKVKKLRGVSYRWKDQTVNKKKNIGFIAQDVQKIIPEIVNKTNNNILGIEYDKLTPLLVESIKELDEKIETLYMNPFDYNIFYIVLFFILIILFYFTLKHSFSL
jgi:hypothetical protein